LSVCRSSDSFSKALQPELSSYRFLLDRVGNKVQFEKMNRALETGGVIPLVDKVFEFEQLKEAYEYLQSGKQIGKVVVRVSSD
jgi:NADPH:quinone reductase-like Zn-dependent oxidoreductase